MPTLRSATLILILPAFFTGCATTAGVSPNIRTVASVGDKTLPVVTGEPGSSVRTEVATPDRPRRNQSRISGRVVDDQGEPMANVKVRVAVDNSAAGKLISTKTDATGGFTLQNVKAGKSYTIIAEDDTEGLVGRAEAEASDTDVRINLFAAGSKKVAKKSGVSPISDREPLEDEEEPAAPVRTKKSKINLEDIDAPPAVEAEALNDDPAEKPRNSMARTNDQAVSRTTARWRAAPAKGSGTTKPEANAGEEEPTGDVNEEPSGEAPEKSASSQDEPLDDDGVDPLPPAREPKKSRGGSSPPDEGEPQASAVEKAAPVAAVEPSPAQEPAPGNTGGQLVSAPPEEMPLPPAEGTPETPVADSGLLPNVQEALPSAVVAAPALTEAQPLPEVNGKAKPLVINPAGSSIDDLEKLVEAAPAAPAPDAPAGDAQAPAVASAAPAPAEADPFETAQPAEGDSQFAPAAAAEAVADSGAAADAMKESPTDALKDAEDPAAKPRKRATWGQITASAPKPKPTSGTMTLVSSGEGRPRLSTLPTYGGRSINQLRSTAPAQPQTQAAASAPAQTEAQPTATTDARTYCDWDPKQRRLKDFRLPNLEGRLVRFQDIDTDLVLLDFWGTWCKPCIRTVPKLVEIQTKLGGKRLTVVGIACEQGAPQDQVQKVAKEAKRLGINYPILMSGLDGPCPLQEALDITALPTLIVVDRQGRIVWRDQGATPNTLTRLTRFLSPEIQASNAIRRY
ncbi:redoxin domain-containing protein [Singulisphaera sp. PoT]|uniref:redoxin domain-containing protein n=1 Tax=Singulisphaera sp. PoT TaxID=3411797 RepID=UPI003BF4EC57